MLAMLAGGATHLGVATDHVIESFRNDLWPGYKTSAGVPADLLAQFPLLEDALSALGVVVWPMVKFEADDALASAAAAAAVYAEQVLICTPDKDLAQCVSGTRVVQLDRRANKLIDEDAVVAKFGVPPASIPDYLALVGDSADGYPGLPGWGAKSAAAVLSKFHHIEDIPAGPARWQLPLRGAAVLAATLRDQRDLAMLFKDLATLRTTVRVRATADRLRWTGPRKGSRQVAERLGVAGLADQASKIASSSA
jgi:5'-3' exonuclease